MSVGPIFLAILLNDDDTEENYPAYPNWTRKERKERNKLLAAEKKQKSLRKKNDKKASSIFKKYIYTSEDYKNLQQGKFSLSYKNIIVNGHWNKDDYQHNQHIQMNVDFAFKDILTEGSIFTNVKTNPADNSPILFHSGQHASYATAKKEIVEKVYKGEELESRMANNLSKLKCALWFGRASFDIMPK